MKILLCVAGMPYAEAAVSFGGLIARITRSPVTLLHVARRVEEQVTGEKALARACEMLSSLSVETRLRGLPSGAAGRLREWLLRNVTRQVVEHAWCSVLVVKRRSVNLPQEQRARPDDM